MSIFGNRYISDDVGCEHSLIYELRSKLSFHVTETKSKTLSEPDTLLYHTYDIVILIFLNSELENRSTQNL